MNNIIKKIMKHKYYITIYLILFVGIMVRIVGISNFPNALNVDEASSGYEAFSILNYGIDRNGNSMPVFLEAWGSGQNALYSYLLIPFIKILGLSVFSIRLPMALLGCLSLFVMYKILEKNTDRKSVIIGTAFFAIVPWHIMKSRWGLESNIFPDLILFATYFVIEYIQTKKIRNIYFCGILLGLSAYSYGTAYFFLPIFVTMLLIYLNIKEELTIKHCIGMFFTVLLISMPIIIFVIINKFCLEPIKLFCFTIPILRENRFEIITSIFGKNVIINSLINFVEAIKILLIQDDRLGFNAFPLYGIIYIVSLPFMIVGIWKALKSKKSIDWIFNIWFISAFLLLFVVQPNINRINIIIIPIIYYTIIGIKICFEKWESIKILIQIIYISFFICFEISYFTTDWNNYYTFTNQMKDILEYVDTLDTNKIYFEQSIKEPCIYICFYNKINTKDFINLVKYKRDIGFERVESLGKYYFYIPKMKERNAVYIIKSINEDKYDFKSDIFHKEYINDFVIIEEE